MIDELCELLQRQAVAATALEARLRALELVHAADDQRFAALALDEVEAATQKLAALELSRVLALSTAGLPVDMAARDLIAEIGDADAAARVRTVVEQLASATERLTDARQRAESVVANGAGHARHRLEAASAFGQH